MLKNLLGPEIRELIERKEWETLKETLENWEAPDIAEFLDDMDSDTDRVILFRLLSRETGAEVFAELGTTAREKLMATMNDLQIREILIDLPPDDRTSLFGELPGEVTQRLVNLLPAGERGEALMLLGYPEQSVGRLMTPHYVAVRPEWTVGRAVNHIRRRGKESETISMVYVTDASWAFLDALELHHFILASPKKKVRDLMDGNFVHLNPYDDREEAVRIMEHYNLPALPVVDSLNVMLGIVTFDDVMDVAKEEATEDFYRTAAVAPLRGNYPEAGVGQLYKKRIPWLMVLIGINLFAGAAMASFEEMISRAVALVFFLPLLIDSGGNAGSQSATLMVRALAMGDVRPGDWVSMLGREVLVAGLLGLTMGLAVWGLGIYRGGPAVAAAVSLAMVAVVMMGSIIGTLLPFLLNLLRMDPATASAPLITSIADICGVLIYFSIAARFLGV